MTACRTNVPLAGFVVAFCLIAFVACGSSNLIGPENQLQMNDAADNFQWQVSALDNVSQTFTHTWQTTGTSVNIDQSSSISGGSATLTITDASGAEVYTRSLADNGTFTSTSGSPGSWTILVELSSVSGTLNFRVQKP